MKWAKVFVLVIVCCITIAGNSYIGMAQETDMDQIQIYENDESNIISTEENQIYFLSFRQVLSAFIQNRLILYQF